MLFFYSTVFSIALIFIIPSVQSQSLDKQLNFNFQKIGLENGLTDVRYNSFIHQDSRGFIWIGSQDGLNRFDGYQVKTYQFESGMKGKMIQSEFFEDKKGNLWFTTYKSLNCYIRSADTIQPIIIYDENYLPISKDFKAFYLDQTKDRLWLKVEDRILNIDINDPEDYVFLNKKILGHSININIVKNQEQEVEKIIIPPWGSKEGIEYLYLENDVLQRDTTFLKDKKSIPKTILLQDSLWFLFSGKELYLFDEKDSNKLKILDNSIDASIWDAILFNDEHLLFSTDNNGLCLYNWVQEKFIKKWQFHEKDKYTLSTNSPKELSLFDNQYLWTSNKNIGVNYTFLYHNNFENPLEDIGLYNIRVSSLDEDKEGNIWVGTEDAGIYVFSSEGKYLFGNKSKSINVDNSKLWQIGSINDGQMFCTSNQGLYTINPTTNQCKKITIPEETSYRFIANVSPNRTLISTTTGVKEIIKNKNQDYQIVDCEEFAAHRDFSFMQFFQTSRNKVYVPFDANELWIYDITKEGLEKVNELKCEKLFYGFYDSNNYGQTVWAGTLNGLVKIIGDSIIQPVFEKGSRLFGVAVYDIIEDNEDKLWLSTNKGLWSYNLKSKALFQYEELDGLSGEVFSMHNASLLSESGEIWMGNNKGLVKFNPKKIKPYDISPQIYIDKLVINDKDILFGIGEQESIHLKYWQNTLEFDVLPIGYYKSERSIVRYKLEGYDKDWLSIENGESIRYTKVPDGNYKLLLIAEDTNKNQSEQKELAIIIEPPFWKTKLFIFFAILLISGLFYIISKYRINQIIKKEERKTALANLKTQVVEVELKALRAQMNPHFLFNSMNSIKGIIIKKDVKNAINYLTKLSSLIRAILSNSEKKSISLANEIEALQLYIQLESLRFTKKFEHQIQVDKNIDSSFVRIPPLILQPFVENAIWHGLIPKLTAPKQLNINLLRKGDFVLCEIQDNGIGRKQSEQVKSKKEHHSMGIDITRKRIQLLHQENEIEIIDLVDDEGKALGTKVIVKLYNPE